MPWFAAGQKAFNAGLATSRARARCWPARHNGVVWAEAARA